jgi:hypothetical protein
MIFEQIRQTLGQMDGQYQKKTQVVATVKQLKKVEYSQSSGKPVQSLLLEAQDAEQSWVKLMGNFDPLDDNYLNAQCEFMIWPFKPEQSPKIYLYCWINRKIDGAAPSAPQTPQNAPQAANTPAPTVTHTPREYVVLGVCNVAARRPDMDTAAILDMCHHLHKWVETGEVDFTVTHEPVDEFDRAMQA